MAAEGGKGIIFVRRIEPEVESVADVEDARLVIGLQAGDRAAFAELYSRHFDPVYSYLQLLFHDRHEAEDAAQHIFTNLFTSLASYERRRQPFRAWLFRVVRNHALNQLERRRRVDLMEPNQINHRREASVVAESLDPARLDFLADRELVLFIERLPLAQRQVLMLRFALDLSLADTAAILSRSESDISVLQHRALAFLRTRLLATRADPSRAKDGARMRRWVPQAPVLRARRFSL